MFVFDDHLKIHVSTLSRNAEKSVDTVMELIVPDSLMVFNKLINEARRWKSKISFRFQQVCDIHISDFSQFGGLSRE